MTIEPIAFIRSDFGGKFGVPRQSLLAPETRAEIVFEKPYRSPEALRGIEGFSHLWVIWQFSKNAGKWSPTVRPPRLGGDECVGVFATRSPFRPNSLGLSCVKLVGVRHTERDGDILEVAGADLMDGTPIFDIKPYVPYADCVTEATGGFTDVTERKTLNVVFPPELLRQIPEMKRAGLIQALAQDPRPAYQSDGERVYGLTFAGRDVRFTVADGVLTVAEVV